MARNRIFIRFHENILLENRFSNIGTLRLKRGNWNNHFFFFHTLLNPLSVRNIFSKRNENLEYPSVIRLSLIYCERPLSLWPQSRSSFQNEGAYVQKTHYCILEKLVNEHFVWPSFVLVSCVSRTIVLPFRAYVLRQLLRVYCGSMKFISGPPHVYFHTLAIFQ